MFKHFITRILLPVFAVTVMAGCSVYEDENGLISDSDKLIPGRKYQVMFNIAAVQDNPSRTTYDSGDYDQAGEGDMIYGTEDEHRIGTTGNYALFFNAQEELILKAPLELNEHYDYNSPTSNIEAKYVVTFYPQDVESLTLPKYVLLLLNAAPLETQIEGFTNGMTATKIMETAWKESMSNCIGRDNNGYFTLTNSAYIDEGRLQTLVEIPPGVVQVVGSSDITREVTVRVERMVAKFDFNFTSGTYDPNTGEYIYDPGAEPIVMFERFGDDSAPVYVSRNWRIGVTGWNVNAFETESRAYKNISSTKNYFPKWTWNDDANYRSYWSEDPHYNKSGVYSWQYRYAVDAQSILYYEKLSGAGTNPLHNFSYESLGLGTKNFDGHVYAPENTFDFAALDGTLDGRTNLLAGTHLLVGANLRIQNASGQYVTGDWYRDREGFYYPNEEQCYRALVYGFNSTLASQKSMRYVYYDWSGENPNLNGKVYYAYPEGLSSSESYYLYYCSNADATPGTGSGSGSGSWLPGGWVWNPEGWWSWLPDWFWRPGTPSTPTPNDGFNPIYYNNSVISNLGSDFLAEATVKNGDGKRLPWPKDGQIQILKYGVNQPVRICDEKGVFVRYATTDDVKSLLYEWVGAIDHFKDGSMYYAAPIVQHYQSPNDICGVVRNHWYRFNLGGIDRMGTPVDNLSQPIVPQRVDIHDQINVSINILDWHLVKTWIPTLP